MFEDDGFGKLGFYSNAALYLGLGVGSILSTGVLNKIGDVRSMVFGAFLCFPWMLSFLLPALKGENPDYTSWLFNHYFVYLVIISLSFINGIGEALLWVA